MKIKPFLNKEPVQVGFLLLAGLIFRCLMISSRGIWYDDAFSILLSRQSFTQIITGTAADTMPPLYYFLLHVWMRISTQIWWMRVLSILLSMSALVLLYFIARRVASKRAAMWALVWGVVSPFQIYHAQELRMYTLLQLAQVAYIFFFVKIIQADRPGWRLWAGFVLSGVISLYTHNLAIFFLPVADLYLLMRKRWYLLGKVVLAQAGMVLLFSPWIFLVPGQVQKIQTAFWTERPGLLEVVQGAVNFIGSLYPTGMLLLVVSAASLILLVFFLFLFFRKADISSDQKFFFGALVLTTPILLFAVSYLMRPIFVPRGFITSMLFFYASGGMVVAAIRPKLARYLLGLTVAGVALLSLPDQYLFDRFPRSPFNKAIGETDSRMTEEAVILHDNKLSFFPAYVYHPEIRQVFLADAPGSTNDTYALQTQQAIDLFPEPSVDEAVDGYQEVYFVVFERTLEDYRSLGVETHPVLDWLEAHYDLADLRNYEDLLIYHYLK